MNNQKLAKIIQYKICNIKKTSFSKSSPFFTETDRGYCYDPKYIYDTVLTTVNKIKYLSSYKEIVDAFMNDLDLYTTDKAYFLAFMYAIISEIELDGEYASDDQFVTYKAMNREYGLPYQKVKPKLKKEKLLDSHYPNEYAIINGLAKVYFIENHEEEQSIVKVMWKKELMDQILGKHSDIEKLGFIQNPYHIDRNLSEISERLLEIIDKKPLEDEYDERISDVCHHSWMMYSSVAIIDLLNNDFDPLFDKASKNRPRITKQLKEAYNKNIEYIKRRV
jgi:hypothetical protein